MSPRCWGSAISCAAAAWTCTVAWRCCPAKNAHAALKEACSGPGNWRGNIAAIYAARRLNRSPIQNRLDPWHGAHYHPHSFGRLKVLDDNEDLLRVRVAYRVVGPLAVEVDATFHCPDPRTIVMTIVDGEGTGSVVETHATPIAAGRTAVSVSTCGL